MRIDLCRKCGIDMEVNRRCKVCNDALEFFCHKCRNKSNEQIHFACIMISLDHALLEVQTT